MGWEKAIVLRAAQYFYPSSSPYELEATAPKSIALHGRWRNLIYNVPDFHIPGNDDARFPFSH